MSSPQILTCTISGSEIAGRKPQHILTLEKKLKQTNQEICQKKQLFKNSGMVLSNDPRKPRPLFPDFYKETFIGIGKVFKISNENKFL